MSRNDPKAIKGQPKFKMSDRPSGGQSSGHKRRFGHRELLAESKHMRALYKAAKDRKSPVFSETPVQVLLQYAYHLVATWKEEYPAVFRGGFNAEAIVDALRWHAASMGRNADSPYLWALRIAEITSTKDDLLPKQQRSKWAKVLDLADEQGVAPAFLPFFIRMLPRGSTVRDFDWAKPLCAK